MTDPLLGHEADLVDLTGLPLSEVLTMDESVLFTVGVRDPVSILLR